MFTKRQYEFIARVISNLPRTDAVRMKAAQAFADDLTVENPRFDPRIFMDACKVPQLLIPAHKLKRGDFLPGWGDVYEIRDTGDGTIDVGLTPRKGEWALSFRKYEPVRIERLNGS